MDLLIMEFNLPFCFSIFLVSTHIRAIIQPPKQIVPKADTSLMEEPHEHYEAKIMLQKILAPDL